MDLVVVELGKVRVRPGVRAERVASGMLANTAIRLVARARPVGISQAEVRKPSTDASGVYVSGMGVDGWT